MLCASASKRDTMPSAIRPESKAKRIFIDILGIPPGGVTDSSGKKKRAQRKKEKPVRPDTER